MGDYIVFMDNDILVREDSFEKLVDFMESNPRAGVCGAMLVPEKGGKIWWNMGYDPNNFLEAVGFFIGFLLKFFPHSQALKNFSTRFILNYWDYDAIRAVAWVIEGCFIIRKKVFEKIGGFDERFFMYFEGPDLCKRAREAGYGVFFNPEAKVDMLEGHTHTSLKRPLFLTRSKYLFYKKHYFYLRSNPLFFWIGKAISGVLYLIG